jgi:hypothetical protein
MEDPQRVGYLGMEMWPKHRRAAAARHAAPDKTTDTWLLVRPGTWGGIEPRKALLERQADLREA